MAGRGPAPKREDARRRRNAPVRPVDKVSGAAGAVPDLDIEGLHPLAVSWFAALSEGAESRYYTPAMWQRARVVAFLLSDLLYADRPSAVMYSALQQDMRGLLVDAAEMRRLNIEVQAAEPAPKSNVIDWRARGTAGA